MLETFETLRPRLFAIAYRMLGSASEADDMVQEAYLRYQKTPAEAIQSPQAFLRTTVIRLCLDSLKSARARREVYPGIWLPEPILTTALPADDPAEIAADHESISFAFLRLLEDLSPDERAVFLLRQVFDYPYPEIATIIAKSESACRQLFSRAKKHMLEHRARFRPSPEEHHQLLGQFMQAVQSGDLEGLTALLASDVVSYGDGGGKAFTSPRPVIGRAAVARLIMGLARFVARQYRVEIISSNGREALLIRQEQGAVRNVMLVEIAAGRIQAFYFVNNPDKLGYVE
jgi:RNA polymerase sigma-70 factor (ECF subfamily)